ncbi:aminoacyl-tRNA hydrolase [Chryseotalea sanaruensis]|uniref:Aminoacyl-tRNA hydrolase n=1 Tax=Chryseotalea sanaruensis TaxID=2482724 RepID=A0A401UBT8_9BACT|nr:alternative ribosome rescue aminoacyl-tRNA hydrolase ArfB [Chryseotalea sanaruensis]GCC52366.1 aminoacyl-tRNA hydrolase [Chryseotalea sanaruensis]
MLTARSLLPEIEFTTSRSSGPGGQNVNKVNSRVTLRLDIKQSELLTDEQREVLLNKLVGKLTTEGVLLINVQDSRSQLENKEGAINRLEALIRKAFTKPKPRKKTKPSMAAKEKRVTDKKQRSEKKKWRQKL